MALPLIVVDLMILNDFSVTPLHDSQGGRTFGALQYRSEGIQDYHISMNNSKPINPKVPCTSYRRSMSSCSLNIQVITLDGYKESR